MPNELKPCPFCGEEAVLSEMGWKFKDKQKRYKVRCSKCWAERGGKALPLNQAIDFWNRRADNGNER